MNDETAGSPVEREVRPVAWMGGDMHPRHIGAFQSATERRIYGHWTPLYDQAALDAAVAAERERLTPKPRAPTHSCDDPLCAVCGHAL